MATKTDSALALQHIATVATHIANAGHEFYLKYRSGSESNIPKLTTSTSDVSTDHWEVWLNDDHSTVTITLRKTGKERLIKIIELNDPESLDNILATIYNYNQACATIDKLHRQSHETWQKLQP